MGNKCFTMPGEDEVVRRLSLANEAPHYQEFYRCIGNHQGETLSPQKIARLFVREIAAVAQSKPYLKQAMYGYVPAWFECLIDDGLVASRTKTAFRKMLSNANKRN